MTFPRSSPPPIHNRRCSLSDLGPDAVSGGRLIAKSWELSGPRSRYPGSCAARAIATFVLSAGIDRSEREPIAERITDLRKYGRGKRIIATRRSFHVTSRGAYRLAPLCYRSILTVFRFRANVPNIRAKRNSAKKVT